MRRLGLWLAVAAACTPGAGTSETDIDLSTDTVQTGTSTGDTGGVQTVTSLTESTPSGDVSTTDADPTTDTSGTTEDPSTDTVDPSTTSTTVPAECGNGVVEGDEVCDDGNWDEIDDCTTKCRPPGCGDGILQPGEKCDDGNDDNNDECTNGCVEAFCGDGIIWDEEEECDDANANDLDDCRSNCRVAQCGDGVVWAGHEVCDDGFNDNEYNGCQPDCNAHATMRCGNGIVEPAWEHCDGPTGYPGVGCDQCLYDFSSVSQMACAKTCTWGGVQGCGQDDADVFCKLRTGNASAKATSYKTSPPTNSGGFPCSDLGVYIELDGDDPREQLGPLPEFGVSKVVLYQTTKIAQTHGADVPVLQAKDLVCNN